MRYVSSEGASPRQLTMPLEETSESARPYRCGMVLLCMGALINWLGFAQNYEHPVRYIGIASIIAGVLLIVSAVCCWARNAPGQVTSENENQEQTENTGVHVIDIDASLISKPPDYASLEASVSPPPTYDEAIKLNPAQLQDLFNNKHKLST